jgi:hypothetical protein
MGGWLGLMNGWVVGFKDVKGMGGFMADLWRIYSARGEYEPMKLMK